MSNMSTIGRRNRRKGADLERLVVRELNRTLPHGFSARRRMQYRGGYHEPDVGVYADGDPLPLWHIECKNGSYASATSAERQARRQAYEHSAIALALKKPRREIQCYILLDTVIISEIISSGPMTLQELAAIIATNAERCSANKEKKNEYVPTAKF